MRTFISTVLLVLCGLVSAAEPVKSAETLYSVEIVVFRTLNSPGVAEDWNIESGTNEPEAPDAAPGRHLAVRALSAENFRLAGTEAALDRSANYRVLAHVGWVQSASARGTGLAVDLSELGIKDLALRGTATLELGRYLYLGLDLTLADAQGGSPPVTFTLKQKRRMKSSERHYFDHPAFGAIAIITPLK